MPPASATLDLRRPARRQGFEGIHIFNISDPANPVFIRALRFADNGMTAGAAAAGCGSHTATAVPDPARDSSTSTTAARAAPATASTSSRSDSSDPTESSSAPPRGHRLQARPPRQQLLPRQQRAAQRRRHAPRYAMCAGGNGLAMFKFDLTLPPSGRVARRHRDADAALDAAHAGVTTGHSGSFTYDGKYLIYGHEPGGGSAARCQATSTVVERTLYFIDPLTGKVQGRDAASAPAEQPRELHLAQLQRRADQGRLLRTVGSYQSGISVFDFGNPAAPKEIAFADPAPLRPRAADHRHRPRWRLVDLLAQRLHLRVRHQARRAHVAPEPRRRRDRDAGQRAPEAHEHVGVCRTRRPRPCPTRPRPRRPTITVRSPVEGQRYKQGTEVVADFDLRRRCRGRLLRRHGRRRQPLHAQPLATRRSGSRRSTAPAT